MSPQSWDAKRQTKQRWGQIGMCTAWPNRGQIVNAQHLQKDSTNAEQSRVYFCPENMQRQLTPDLVVARRSWREAQNFEKKMSHSSTFVMICFQCFRPLIYVSIPLGAHRLEEQSAACSILESGHASERSLYIKGHSCALANRHVLVCMWYRTSSVGYLVSPSGELLMIPEVEVDHNYIARCSDLWSRVRGWHTSAGSRRHRPLVTISLDPEPYILTRSSNILPLTKVSTWTFLRMQAAICLFAYIPQFWSQISIVQMLVVMLHISV